MPVSETVQHKRHSTHKKTTLALLLASGFGLIALFMLAMPAVQASRSTDLADRTNGAMGSLVYLVPLLLLIAYASFSAFRIPSQSPLARFAAISQFLATLAFTIWLIFELLL
ncbi:MAG: hypothetical protein MUC43_16775 [Pirellula sp.]|jgi:hypothetical protein|nr:hypothetical protein [Pirellula sp.]